MHPVVTASGVSAEKRQISWIAPPIAADFVHVGLEPLAAHWEEHCSECDAPGCYASCALHEPAAGVGCRRFEYGIDLQQDEGSWTGAHADMQWRNWAALKTKTTAAPGPNVWTYGFLLQAHLESDKPTFSAELAISSSPWTLTSPCIRFAVVLHSGANELYVSPADLQPLSGADAVEARLVFFDEHPRRSRVYAAHFVKGVTDRNGRMRPACKLVCLDLDGTLWAGVSDEAAPEELGLLPGVRRALTELKRRRVSLVAISRASPQAATRALVALGLRGFFDELIFAQSSKSDLILEAARRRSLAADEIAVVDDDAFERYRLSVELPDIALVPAEGLPSFWLHPCMATNVSSDQKPWSRPRRLRRAVDLESSVGAKVDYRPLVKSEIIRAWELLHRAHRMHCIVWRPTLAEFSKQAEDDEWAIRIGVCSDSLANYGIACVAAVDAKRRQLRALTFSCRLLERAFPDAFVSDLLAEFDCASLGDCGTRLAPHAVRLLERVRLATVPALTRTSK